MGKLLATGIILSERQGGIYIYIYISMHTQYVSIYTYGYIYIYVHIYHVSNCLCAEGMLFAQPCVYRYKNICIHIHRYGNHYMPGK